MNPRFPLYIPSRSRADVALTPRFLDSIGVPYRLVVERDQLEDYAAHFDAEKLIVLDPAYQRDYDTCDEFGDSQPKGSGPARNFIWDHAIADGHAWHWIMDDNIKLFARLHQNKRVPVGDGWIFNAMETFVLRYSNVAMAGPHYWMFAPSRTAKPPFTTGSRVYSCNLIRNDVAHRWRGRWNEDTILSLDVLKDGWATVLFNAFLQYKMSTQKVPGGNTENYQKQGTLTKSQMLARLHPDVARVAWRYGRWHHYVDYSRWRGQPLARRADYDPATEPDYRFRTVARAAGRATGGWTRGKAKDAT